MTTTDRPFADALCLEDTPEELAARRRLEAAFSNLEDHLEDHLERALARRAPDPAPKRQLRFRDPAGRDLVLDREAAFPTLHLHRHPAGAARPGLLRVWRVPADLVHPADAALARRADLLRDGGICLPRRLSPGRPRSTIGFDDLLDLAAACRWTAHVLRAHAIRAEALRAG